MHLRRPAQGAQVLSGDLDAGAIGENHGHGGNGNLQGQYCWNIDHVVPRSALKFDSLDHPNFAKCWALENIRPLEFMENVLRQFNS